jgi:glutamate-1-semialdehyde 2,1-aminomutase
MAAGIVTLRVLSNDGVYRVLDKMGSQLADGLREAARVAECAVSITQLGSMLTVFFSDETPRDYDSAKRADTARYARFFNAMLDRGVYLPPAQFEAMFVSLSHKQADLDSTIEAAQEAFAAAVSS